MSNLKLFSECIPVKSYNRAIIYDVSRRDFSFIPNSLYNILTRLEGTSKDNILSKFSESDKETIGNYLDFLADKEYIFWCDSDELKLFPKLSMNWDFPAHITNTIITISDIQNMNYPTLLNWIEEIGCKNIQMRFIGNNDLTCVEYILNIIQKSQFKSIEIYIRYKENLQPNRLEELMRNNYRLRFLSFYSSPNSELIQKGNGRMGNIIYLTEDIGMMENNTNKDPSYFNINIPLFTESQKHNTYFNRKLYIGNTGEIKNAPECNIVCGNVITLKNSEEILTIINMPNFQKFWYVNKGLIDICKQCEFRYMCVDNRVPVKRNEKEWFMNTECNYNPFIAKWKNEKGYKTLLECGITSNQDGFKINHKKLNFINRELWGD